MNDIKILIIEDEMIHAMHLKNAIERTGYSVADILSSGEDAVESVLRNKPDLIITDILLEGDLNGIEAMKEIWKHIEVPFILLSALYEDMKTYSETEPAPCAILTKPYDMNKLIMIINKIFHRDQL